MEVLSTVTFVHAGQDHAYCSQGSQSHDICQSMGKDHRILVWISKRSLSGAPRASWTPHLALWEINVQDSLVSSFEGRVSFLSCRAQRKMKMQASCFKSKEKVPLKILKYKAFSFCWSFPPQLTVFSNLLFNGILSREKLKLYVSMNFTIHLRIV